MDVKIEVDQLPIIEKTDGYQDGEICGACRGACCVRAPGIAWPDDFGPRETLTAVLIKYLSTGFWAVDCWGGSAGDRDPKLRETVFYMRPRESDHPGEILHRGWGGQCALWTWEHGCSLRFENRPMQCRQLRPEPDPNTREMVGCAADEKFSEMNAARAWSDYQEEIKSALLNFGIKV